jgi:hypothetical protein
MRDRRVRGRGRQEAERAVRWLDEDAVSFSDAYSPKDAVRRGEGTEGRRDGWRGGRGRECRLGRVRGCVVLVKAAVKRRSLVSLV